MDDAICLDFDSFISKFCLACMNERTAPRRAHPPSCSPGLLQPALQSLLIVVLVDIYLLTKTRTSYPHPIPILSRAATLTRGYSPSIHSSPHGTRVFRDSAHAAAALVYPRPHVAGAYEAASTEGRIHEVGVCLSQSTAVSQSLPSLGRKKAGVRWRIRWMDGCDGWDRMDEWMEGWIAEISLANVFNSFGQRVVRHTPRIHIAVSAVAPIALLLKRHPISRMCVIAGREWNINQRNNFLPMNFLTALLASFFAVATADKSLVAMLGSAPGMGFTRLFRMPPVQRMQSDQFKHRLNLITSLMLLNMIPAPGCVRNFGSKEWARGEKLQFQR
ncbi:hypothetical protein FB451DRAFT_1178610 [Mycena latifolia]|nr:hypothetical protein FB451DRAFT_1178610 [Mycena latifolia]